MPSPALKTMAKKAGKSLADAERYWKEAKESAEEQGFEEGTKNFYRYVMGIVKKRLRPAKKEKAGLKWLDMPRGATPRSSLRISRRIVTSALAARARHELSSNIVRGCLELRSSEIPVIRPITAATTAKPDTAPSQKESDWTTLTSFLAIVGIPILFGKRTYPKEITENYLKNLKQKAMPFVKYGGHLRPIPFNKLVTAAANYIKNGETDLDVLHGALLDFIEYYEDLQIDGSEGTYDDLVADIFDVDGRRVKNTAFDLFLKKWVDAVIDRKKKDRDWILNNANKYIDSQADAHYENLLVRKASAELNSKKEQLAQFIKDNGDSSKSNVNRYELTKEEVSKLRGDSKNKYKTLRASFRNLKSLTAMSLAGGPRKFIKHDELNRKLKQRGFEEFRDPVFDGYIQFVRKSGGSGGSGTHAPVFFTRHKERLRVPLPPGSEIELNPKFESARKSGTQLPFYLKFRNAAVGGNWQRVQLLDVVQQRTEEKFKSIKTAAIASLRKNWTKHLLNDASPNQMQAAVYEFIYQTGARPGNNRVTRRTAAKSKQETIGVTTLLNKHVKKVGNSFKFEYRQKAKGARAGEAKSESGLNKFILTREGGDRALNKLIEIIDTHTGSDKPKNSPVFPVILQRKGKDGEAGDISTMPYDRLYRFSRIVGQKPSKLRTFKATSIVSEILKDKTPALIKRHNSVGVTPDDIHKEFLEAASTAADELGHTVVKVDGVALNRTTTIKHYIDPAVVENFFAAFGYAPPQYMYEMWERSPTDKIKKLIQLEVRR